MAAIDINYLDDLIKRFRGYKSITDTQSLIILLGTQDSRDKEDDRKLAVLLRAEKKADELAKARATARRLVDADKVKARKAEVRRKIVWASALKKASQNNHRMAEVMIELFGSEYISDDDKKVVKDDYIDIMKHIKKKEINDRINDREENNLADYGAHPPAYGETRLSDYINK